MDVMAIDFRLNSDRSNSIQMPNTYSTSCETVYEFNVITNLKFVITTLCTDFNYRKMSRMKMSRKCLIIK